ncbi:MAG: hypothetical protein V7K39_18585 [Nostoc sp.]
MELKLNDIVKLPFFGHSQPDPLHKIQLAYLQEQLRQAKLTFDLSAVAVTFSISISVVGAALLFSGRTSEGAVTTTSGLISTSLCAQIAKDATDKLERLAKGLKSVRQIND